MDIRYPEVGVCGLSCRLCPMYNSQTESRCAGCKSSARIVVGCPFITCAVKKKGIEFCWLCPESSICKKWQQHREAGKRHDSFKCYQNLEADIAFIQTYGVSKFEEQQKIREALLKQMLAEFNEGRSKSYYCIAATVLEVDELQEILDKAKRQSKGMPLKAKSKMMHSLLDFVASKRGYILRLRR